MSEQHDEQLKFEHLTMRHQTSISHEKLDWFGVPRKDHAGNTLTLYGRLEWLERWLEVNVEGFYDLMADKRTWPRD